MVCPRTVRFYLAIIFPKRQDRLPRTVLCLGVLPRTTCPAFAHSGTPIFSRCAIRYRWVCSSQNLPPMWYSLFGAPCQLLPIAATALGHIRHQTVGETMQTAGATSLHHREITVACRVKAFLSCIPSCSAVVPSRLLTTSSSPDALVGLEPDSH